MCVILKTIFFTITSQESDSYHLPFIGHKVYNAASNYIYSTKLKSKCWPQDEELPNPATFCRNWTVAACWYVSPCNTGNVSQLRVFLWKVWIQRNFITCASDDGKFFHASGCQELSKNVQCLSLTISVSLFCMHCVKCVYFLLHKKYKNPCLVSHMRAGIAQSVYRLATGWTVRGSNPGGGEIFRNCPDRPRGPPSLLYKGYLSFPGVKSGRGVSLTPHPLLVPWS